MVISLHGSTMYFFLTIKVEHYYQNANMEVRKYTEKGGFFLKNLLQSVRGQSTDDWNFFVSNALLYGMYCVRSIFLLGHFRLSLPHFDVFLF